MPRHVRPTHRMQRAFLVSRTSVHLVSARPLNNQARYNDVDFTRLKANRSNTGHFAVTGSFNSYESGFQTTSFC